MSDEDKVTSHPDAPPSREDALRVELAGVRKINTVIEGVVASLEKAKDNMETISQTVTNANTLLDLWIRILSQTEHTQRLLLSGHWAGATQDLDDIEAETASRLQEAERRKEAERERREEREREAAEAERRREVAEKKTAVRGRGRGRPRSALPAPRGGGRIAAPPPQVPAAGGRGTGTGGRGGRVGSGVGRGIWRGRGV